MFNFQPDQQEKKLQFFDEVRASDGWEGHTTTKTIERLTQEIQNNLALIGCVYVGCQRGKFGDRYGFQIHFAMKSASGQMAPGRLDIACLPLKKKYSRYGKKDLRIEGTQKMALYMTAKAIKGMYFLSVLSQDFVPFMSNMLTQNNQTLGALWMDSGNLTHLLPASTDKFEVVDAVEVKEIR
jgi:hypothetical protein